MEANNSRLAFVLPKIRGKQIKDIDGKLRTESNVVLEL